MGILIRVVFLFHIPQWKYLNAVIFYLFLTYRSAKDPCSYWNRDPKNYIEWIRKLSYANTFFRSSTVLAFNRASTASSLPKVLATSANNLK